jgi:hypothetical protein
MTATAAATRASTDRSDERRARPNVSLPHRRRRQAGWVSVTGRAEIAPMDGDPSSDAAMIVATPIRFLWEFSR